jgi:hypothetical protein
MIVAHHEALVLTQVALVLASGGVSVGLIKQMIAQRRSSDPSPVHRGNHLDDF